MRSLTTYRIAIGCDDHDLFVCTIAKVLLQIREDQVEHTLDVIRNGHRMTLLVQLFDSEVEVVEASLLVSGACHVIDALLLAILLAEIRLPKDSIKHGLQTRLNVLKGTLGFRIAE